MNNNKQTKNWKRVSLKILCCVFALILIFLIIGTVLMKGFLGRVDRIENLDKVTLSTQQIQDILNATDAIEPGFTGEIVLNPEVPTGPAEVIADNINTINILLIGQDRRPGEYRARSDAMILVTINKTAKTLTMTSFLRDTWVSIPGYFNDRLNVPYVLGGFPLLNETLEYNFGVSVDYNLEVDFDSFEKAIELVGGMDVDLTAEEAAHLNNKETNWALVEGLNHLDGKQALAYSRIRYLGTDFGRTNRQRVVLSALIDKAKKLSATELVKLIYDLLPMVRTDMTDGEIVNVITELVPLLTGLQIVSQHIPAQGAYSYALIDNKAVIYLDQSNLAKNIQILKETIGLE